MASSQPTPKAILYYTPTSVWSSAALLALEEKGYGSDELEMKIVDMKSGENYTPAFIRINPNATVPTLVVPLERTLYTGVANKYRALTDSKVLTTFTKWLPTDPEVQTILEFLDKSHLNTTSESPQAPAPALAPATVALSDLSNAIITLVQSIPVNNLSIAVTTSEGLSAKAQSPRAEYVRGRYAALEKHISGQSENTNDIVKELWETRHTENGVFVRVYGAAGKSASELSDQEKQDRDRFFAKSAEIWIGIRNILVQLEECIVGPYALGDQISLADLHIVGAWHSRIFFVSDAPSPRSAQATPKAGDAKPMYPVPGFSAVERFVGEHTGDPSFTLGPKVCAFWELLVERDSWREVYANGLH